MLASLYMVVVLGCTDDLVRCREIARGEEGFPSAAACEAAINDTLAARTDADYPMIAGRCELARPLLVAGGASPAS